MDGKALVESVKKEVIEPGIERLMDTQYFTELRHGKLNGEQQGQDENPDPNQPA